MPKPSVTDLLNMKQEGKKIVCLTAYDASFAAQAVENGVDILLVGDSLGMVVQGKESTVPVTLDEMIYHTAAVRRGSAQTMVIADMPFMSFSDVQQTLHNAGRLMKEGGAHMVKLEGAHPQILDSVRALSSYGIPVCGHLGLLPQSVYKLGGYKVQGREEDEGKLILKQALELQAAGADLLVLECLPARLAERISSALTIPTIGIGAGVDTDGQVLVLYDMLGVTLGKRPKFSKNFMQGRDSIGAAIAAYVAEVRSSQFPAPEHGF
ncbi:MAG: 3-methyl-2-oxobutanoate hydroxymethyltransferase [Gammaproteobacteria bacterium]|nr:3-methyl-2-oxobutanoate hydroxymethyltransferase [Gammaproteobacteria bacterium]